MGDLDAELDEDEEEAGAGVHDTTSTSSSGVEQSESSKSYSCRQHIGVCLYNPCWSRYPFSSKDRLPNFVKCPE